MGNTYEMENLYQIKYFDSKIDNLKSKRDKGKKSHKQRYNKSILKLYHKRNDQITHALHIISNYLVQNYDVVIIGNYTPSTKGIQYKEMKRKMINQSIISKFRNILKYKCELNNKKYIEIDEKFTTQTCFICGNTQKLTPEMRTYNCRSCGCSIHRDINSAINIGKKTNLLSNSDYNTMDLSKVLYTVKYSLAQNNLHFTELKQ